MPILSLQLQHKLWISIVFCSTVARISSGSAVVAPSSSDPWFCTTDFSEMNWPNFTIGLSTKIANLIRVTPFLVDILQISHQYLPIIPGKVPQEAFNWHLIPILQSFPKNYHPAIKHGKVKKTICRWLFHINLHFRGFSSHVWLPKGIMWVTQ